ncbi:hypothetical protein B0H11DRAFT_1250636 [Mycena galericulata]|nr:hypothetical protein B0H11DRAFT_1250636 [Mycena galericulata]
MIHLFLLSFTNIPALSNFMSLPNFPAPGRIRHYMSRLEQEYTLPAKQFLNESLNENPLVTTVMVIFAVTSFTPVITSVALAVFTIVLALSACLVVLVGLALGLIVLLASTLFISGVLTVLVAGPLRLRRSIGRTSTPETETETEHSGPQTTSIPPFAAQGPPGGRTTAFRDFSSPFKHVSRKRRLFAVIVIGHLISRIRLPRVVRHSLIYRTLFGTRLFGPRPPPLQRALAFPSIIVRTVSWLPFKLALLPFRILGWNIPLLVCISLLIASPRLRAAARRALARGALRLSNRVAQSAPVAFALNLPWKAYTAAALAAGKEAIIVLVAFLRAQLEDLEAKVEQAAEAADTAQTQDEDAKTYEMVPPVVPDDVSGSTGVSASMSGEETLRARNVSTSGN